MILTSLLVPASARGDTTSGRLNWKGIGRSYILYAPPTQDARPRPLIVAMHAFGQTPTMMMNQDRFRFMADTAGFIVVYPQGYEKGWNAGICCGEPTEAHQNIDDVGFIRALVDTLTRKFAIDKNRVYASGYSNGAMMAHRLACEASDVFAAVGGASGGLALADNSRCRPSRPVSVCNFHALNDPTVGYYAWKGDAPGVGIPDVMSQWARLNGCEIGPDSATYNYDATVTRWSRSGSTVEVILYTTSSTAHSWPSTIPTSRILWDFFRRHALDEVAAPITKRPRLKKK